MKNFRILAVLGALLGSMALAASTLAADTIATNHLKILMVLTSHDRMGNTDAATGFYLSEATHAYDELVNAGYEIDFVSPQGGAAPVDGLRLEDPINKKYWDDSRFRQGIAHTLKPAEIHPADYAAIYYAGGHGAMWDFPQNDALAAIAASIYERGGVVAAVCHGVAGLLPIKRSDGTSLIKDQDLAAFTNDEETAVKREKVVPFLLADALVAKGAHHHPAPNWQEKVVISGRIITGQNPASAKGVAQAMVKTLAPAQK